MNTSTRVEFGLYDVTARSDSTPTTEQAKAFCNLSKEEQNKRNNSLYTFRKTILHNL